MEVLNKLLTLLMALVMSVNLSGCGSSTDAADVQFEPDIIAQGNTDDSEVCLPDGYTMEDLLNGFKINGKTLTYPITINRILACDDRFTYELAPIYDGCKTPEEVFDYFHYPNVCYDILCDGHKLIQVSIRQGDYFNYGAENSSIHYLGYGFYSIDFKECDVELTYLDKINFDSSYGDMVSCIGKPAYAENDIVYKFKDDGIQYRLSFHANDSEFINGKGNIVTIGFLIKSEDIDGNI